MQHSFIAREMSPRQVAVNNNNLSSILIRFVRITVPGLLRFEMTTSRKSIPKMTGNQS